MVTMIITIVFFISRRFTDCHSNHPSMILRWILLHQISTSCRWSVVNRFSQIKAPSFTKQRYLQPPTRSSLVIPVKNQHFWWLPSMISQQTKPPFSSHVWWRGKLTILEDYLLINPMNIYERDRYIIYIYIHTYIYYGRINHSEIGVLSTNFALVSGHLPTPPSSQPAVRSRELSMRSFSAPGELQLRKESQ